MSRGLHNGPSVLRAADSGSLCRHCSTIVGFAHATLTLNVKASRRSTRFQILIIIAESVTHDIEEFQTLELRHGGDVCVLLC